MNASRGGAELVGRGSPFRGTPRPTNPRRLSFCGVTGAPTEIPPSHSSNDHPRATCRAAAVRSLSARSYDLSFRTLGA